MLNFNRYFPRSQCNFFLKKEHCLFNAVNSYLKNNHTTSGRGDLLVSYAFLSRVEWINWTRIFKIIFQRPLCPKNWTVPAPPQDETVIKSIYICSADTPESADLLQSVANHSAKLIIITLTRLKLLKSPKCTFVWTKCDCNQSFWLKLWWLKSSNICQIPEVHNNACMPNEKNH